MYKGEAIVVFIRINCNFILVPCHLQFCFLMPYLAVIVGVYLNIYLFIYCFILGCPSCGLVYAQACGGCMMYKCSHCSFEFCGFCIQPLKKGRVRIILIFFKNIYLMNYIFSLVRIVLNIFNE